MWDIPGPGFEPVSLALAGGSLTTASPGKPPFMLFNVIINSISNFNSTDKLKVNKVSFPVSEHCVDFKEAGGKKKKQKPQSKICYIGRFVCFLLGVEN